MPSWTWLDEESEALTEEVMEARRSALDMICQRINAIETQREQTGWARQAAMENPGEYDGPDYDTPEEAEQANETWRMLQRIDRETEDATLAALHRELNALGARMMRPYEHWNEDEAYMQYMERDRY